MLWFICFFSYADRQAIFAVFLKLKQEFGFDKVQPAALIVTAMLLFARHQEPSVSK